MSTTRQCTIKISFTPDPEKRKTLLHYLLEEMHVQNSQALTDPATPLVSKALNSPLPSSESICYQINRRESDSLLFSTLADLYAECKTDALCDTYLW